LSEKRNYVIIEAPSILGLRPTGVQHLPEALKKAGLIERLKATNVGIVNPISSYNSKRDPTTQLLNAEAIRIFSKELSKALCVQLEKENFPIVLGGDCSILIGCLLGLRKLGRYGLFFIDGHSDFYQPQASPTGEVADMDLAFISGRGPEILSDIDGLKPLVRDEDIVVFGYRDTDESARYGSQDVNNTSMNVFDISKIRILKFNAAVSVALSKILTNQELSGFWIHLDVDVLDDKIMPAVDYRLHSTGIEFSELSLLLRRLVESKKAIGMTVTIFNPYLDPRAQIADKLVSSIVSGLSLID
jgi:arginase